MNYLTGVLLLSYICCTCCFVVANSRNDRSFAVKAMKDSSTKTTSTKPKPWEWTRFLKTLSFYEVFKPRFSGFKYYSERKKEAFKLNKDFLLWSPTNKDLMQWGPLDDVVMGGRSKSDLQFGEEFNGTWTGISTAEGGGGFTGIRTKLLEPALDVSDCMGFEITVKGDGQRYKFITRWDEEWNGIAWSYSFDTVKDKTIKVRIPLSKLKPTRYAKTLPDAFFSRSTLRALQISLSKFEYDGALNPSWREGPFYLKVESIKTYSDDWLNGIIKK